jgi:hypothetical protein
MRRLFLATLMVLLFAGIHESVSAGDQIEPGKLKEKRMKFSQIYEPSGIIQLVDGRLLLIEDESTHPFSLCVLEEYKGQPSIARAVNISMSDIADDLEGLTHGPDGWIYAITSHSREKSGKASGHREKLLRFRVDEEGKLKEYSEYDGLLPAMLAVLDGLDSAAGSINIEGLSADRDRNKLLIGLREPVVAGAALIVTLENPEGLFERGESPRLASQIVRLQLQGGGIRAMAYVKELDGYLIANEIVPAGGKPKPWLWFWDGVAGHAARRLNFPGSDKLKNIEGISPVSVQGRSLLLLVCDDGKRQKGDAAHYRFVEFDQLVGADAIK